MIAGVNNTGEVRSLLLDGLYGAPENSLPAASVVGVGVEEPYGRVSVPPTSDYDD